MKIKIRTLPFFPYYILHAIFLLLALSTIYYLLPAKLHADWWVENSTAHFSDGFFFRTTSTVQTPALSLRRVDDWYQVAQSTWLNRKPIKISNPGGALTQYQLQLTIDTSGYISAGKMRSDGADIRITDEDGKTLLPYWIGISTTLLSTSQTTPILVKIPNIGATSEKYIYFYFNNLSTGTSLSNRVAVDDLYEDWETGTINMAKWTLGGARGAWPYDADLFKITVSSKYEGNYAVRSGTINHTQNTFIETTLNLEMSARVSFWWACSVEPLYDNFIFTINGAQPSGGAAINGEVRWKLETFDLPQGAVTLRWQYQRDSGGDGGLNLTWLDFISVRKHAASPPTLEYRPNEDFVAGGIHTSGYYLSGVFDMGGENSIIYRASWTATTPPGTGVSIDYRRHNTWFPIQSGTITWTANLTNGGVLSGHYGRFIQYRANLTGPGTTTSALVEISFDYSKVPMRPSGFTGVAVSSTAIRWGWTDNSNPPFNEESGFRIYSGTRTIPTSPEGFINDTAGLLYEIPANVTSYIEYNLLPNTLYNRYVVAFNPNGGNASSRLSDGLLLPVGVTTFALVPVVNSEVAFYASDADKTARIVSYMSIPATTHLTHSTFNFTSNIYSTGPGKAAYYRVVWSTLPTHTWLHAETLWFAPTNYLWNDFYSAFDEAKPQIPMWSRFNSESWYFHIMSYNSGDVPSASRTLGPYFFNGAPAQITNLVAEPNNLQEGAVNLSWTAPTANSTFTNITGGRYVVRWSPSIIVTDAAFDTSPGVTLSTTTIASSKESLLITGLTPGNTFWFAIKTADSENNFSPISTNTIITNTRTTAAKVARITFITPPKTTEVGAPTSIITLEAQNAAGQPLRLFNPQNVNLYSTSGLGEFSLDGVNFGISFVNIPQGQTQANFYYRDLQSGSPTLTTDESPDAGWIAGTQQQTILPAKAVKFVLNHDGAGSIGIDENLIINANDGINVNNISTDYQGGIISPATHPGISVVPSTHMYTTSDAGTRQFIMRNNLFFAGPVVVSVREVIEQNYRAVFSIGNRAWAVADEGIIKKTVDSGDQWFAQKYSTGAANGLFGVHTPDGENIFVSGVGGMIHISTNSGTSWFSRATGVSEQLNDIFFVNTSTGYAVGNSGRVVKSTSSGDTWTNLGQRTGNPQLNSVYFLNASTGFVAGAGGNIFKTADGGSSWSSIPAGVTDELRKIIFTDANNGHIVTGAGRILRTTDGGNTWTSQTPTANALHSVSFIDSSRGIVVGDRNTILRTTDGGATWIFVSSQPTGQFYGVTHFSPSIAVAVGERGSIHRTSDGGSTWNEVFMSGISSEMRWNGLVSTITPVATELVQGKANQPVFRMGLWNLYGGSSWINRMTFSRTGSASNVDVSAVRVYIDRNGNRVFDTGDEPHLGDSWFDSANVANVNFAERLITGTTVHFFVTYSLTPTAPIGQTLGARLDFGCVWASAAGIAFSRNNLPYDFIPVEIIPSSCTVRMTITNLTPPTAKQGTKDVLLSSFSMLTDIGRTPFQRLRVDRIGINTTDESIERINLYRDEIISANLVSSAAFSGGVALLSIPQDPLKRYPFVDIDNRTTAYYFLTANISPTSLVSTDVEDVTFGITTRLATTYFTLDSEGANGIVVIPSTPAFNSGLIKLLVAFDTVLVNPIIASIPVLRQSDKVAFLPLRMSLDANIANWTKIRIDRLGTSLDSDIANVHIARDINGNGQFDDGTDTVVGSGRFSNGVSDIVFPNPEILDRALPAHATYFIVCEISKRATVGATLGLRLANTSYITLAGVDIVSPVQFPINSETATIADYPDVVTANIRTIAPRDATVMEKNAPLLSLELLAFCDATLRRVTISLEGSASPENVLAAKIYLDADNNTLFSPVSDTLLGSGTFSGDGRATIDLTVPLTVFDTTRRIFVVYDFNEHAPPGRTVGAGIDSTGLEYNAPNTSHNFGYVRSSMLNLLDKRTPTLANVKFHIDNPSGAEVVAGRKTYFINVNSRIGFNWESVALNGVRDIGYAIATFDFVSSTQTPDVSGWRTTTSREGAFDNLNLRHNNRYFLWFRVTSTDNFERFNTFEARVDLTPPPPPEKPTTTAGASSPSVSGQTIPAGYWVSWPPVTDGESGILYYELSERVGTGMWVVVGTATATEYFIDSAAPSEFYYYRVRAKNLAGTWSAYSLPSLVAFLSPPAKPLDKLSTYPNPFDSRRTECNIVYILNQNAKVDLRIYDLFGHPVRQWNFDTGAHGGAMGLNELKWDGTDENNRKVAMGLYILSVEITTPDAQKTRKRWKIGVIH